ncbi:MAG: nuclear transport factor 2 family protein [Hyphomicrobiaceae bacterium]|nr:nuclear transport factor 2 family protein [Hyphomicrobiaceae bacterium]MCC0023212.1 nuclear transport factor 2 family protein [Hyphomicrobiaceae bacterium]
MEMPLEISNFFLSMQAGAAGARSLAARFAEDAVYEEPFTGEMRRHEGRDAVMQAMALGWEQPLQDMEILVDSLSARGNEIVVKWTCISPSLPGGQGQGTNRFQLKDGLITQLITTMGH